MFDRLRGPAYNKATRKSLDILPKMLNNCSVSSLKACDEIWVFLELHQGGKAAVDSNIGKATAKLDVAIVYLCDRSLFDKNEK
jgi:hypothetical protein